MTAIATKVESLLSTLQSKINAYNETAATLEKTKEEILSLQGAINALKELQSEEEQEVSAVQAEVVS
jgi:hypothetical protein